MGQEGKAQLADGLQIEDAGEADERENLDEVVRGGDGSDFKGIRIGLPRASGGDGVKEMVDVGEGDMSVTLWEDIMVWMRIEVGRIWSSL